MVQWVLACVSFILLLAHDDCDNDMTITGHGGRQDTRLSMGFVDFFRPHLTTISVRLLFVWTTRVQFQTAVVSKSNLLTRHTLLDHNTRCNALLCLPWATKEEIRNTL